MKNIGRVFGSTLIVGGLLIGGSAVFAASMSSPTVTPRLNAVAMASLDEKDQQQTQTFTGRISQKEGKCVLTGENKKSYNLDDQEKAKQFEGQKVKVTGSLDKDTNTIHVSDIQSS